MGLEPTTLSLGSASSTAWLSRFRSTDPNPYRWNPFGTAAAGWRLARGWRAGSVAAPGHTLERLPSQRDAQAPDDADLAIAPQIRAPGDLSTRCRALER